MLYFDGDENKRMVRTEILAKKLGSLVDARMRGGKKVVTKRAEGRIFLDFVSLATLTVTDAESFEVLWNLELLATLGLPRAEIEKELRAAGSADAGVQWG